MKVKVPVADVDVSRGLVEACDNLGSDVANLLAVQGGRPAIAFRWHRGPNASVESRRTRATQDYAGNHCAVASLGGGSARLGAC